ncbi:MAG: ABC transporter permease [Holophagaceae bacterium]|uniref:ABC transporter permease n=1 Tax=Candidatus Geothrix skivensis TaxID=2954439 RepID=A0A9D7XLN5_9BACT|nr:ABC transporter permease [Candidatus Geothrix skivensis]
MIAFFRLVRAEGLKLRHSAVLRLIWVIPILFLAVEFLVFERPFLGLGVLNAKAQATLDTLQLKMVVSLWGFLHPLVLALLPALLFRPEHRFKTWRHLLSMPIARGSLFLAKAFHALILSALVLLILCLLLWIERRLLGLINPALAIPFHGAAMARTLSWLWLGSLPALAIYLWASDRISSLAVPIFFGLVGLLMAIALTGEELHQPWRRDLIPWVLPYAAAERQIHAGPSQQEVHLAGRPFQPEPNVLRLPSGRKIKTWQNAPDEVIFPPPKPTPAGVLATFSLGAAVLVLLLAWMDAKRCRI